MLRLRRVDRAPVHIQHAPVQLRPLKGAGAAVKLLRVLSPELGCSPRVYYRNIPGQFIGGTVYDPVEKEVVIGAKCRLTSGGKVWQTETDGFGDFWFRDLPVGVFDLVIQAKGFVPRTFSHLNTRDCLNLDDIPLERAE